MHHGVPCGPSTVLALPSIEVRLELLPLAVAQPEALQHHRIRPGLVVGGVQRSVARGRRIPSRLFLGAFQFLVVLVGVEGCGASRLCLGLLQTGAHVSGDGEASGCRLGGCIGCVVSLDPHMAGNPVEPDSLALGGEALQESFLKP